VHAYPRFYKRTDILTLIIIRILLYFIIMLCILLFSSIILIQIATMTNGDRLSFIKNVFLPASIRHTTRSDHSSTYCQTYKTKSPKMTSSFPVEETTSLVKEDDWSPIWEFLPNVEKNPKTKDTYQVAIVMFFVGLGFLIFMIVTIRILYNMFKFKQGIDNESSKKTKAAKKRKRTNSVISRRASRASSVISTRSF